VSVCKVTGKWGYESRRAAKEGRRRQPKLRVGSNASGSVRPYRCDHCDAWHLGHMPTAAIRTSRAEIFNGAPSLQQKRPPKTKLGLAPPATRRRPLVVSAHVFFQTRLCDHPRCGEEQPCFRHGRKAA
jgi:hypothetical protein